MGKIRKEGNQTSIKSGSQIFKDKTLFRLPTCLNHFESSRNDMEGLIKGLADVAFGGDERRDGDDQRDERPRSTWANVCPIPFIFFL